MDLFFAPPPHILASNITLFSDSVCGYSRIAGHQMTEKLSLAGDYFVGKNESIFKSKIIHKVTNINQIKRETHNLN